MKVLSLFSGIGAFELALKRIGVNVELVGFSEIDKYATKSYCSVHGVSEDLNLGDISKIDLTKLKELGDIDLITHGSPCQDFSIAGRLAGGDKGSGTRSSLMWCTVDIVKAVRPKYVVWENVKNLLSSKNRHNFDGYLEIMDKLGYNSYYKVLNAKNYGIPQNRERVFTVSIRKDIDEGYEFPEEIELTKKLKDVLEESVDEKYYLSDKLIAGLIANTERQREKGNGFTFETTDGDCVAKTVTTRVGACRSGDNYIQVVGKLDIKGHDCVKRVYSGEGLAPTLTDMQGGNRQPKVLIDEPVIAASRGRNPDRPGDRTPGIPTEQRLEINKQGISNTITTVQKDNYVIEPCLRIRKDIKQEEKYCEYCGKQLERKRFNGRLEDFTVFKNRKYCNRECMKRAFLKIGENKQTYSNAHTTARKINDLILHKEVCEICGSDTNLDIHHIDGNWQNNNLDNLMCLCRSCHTKYERNKDKIGGETPMDDRLRIRKLTPKECWRL